MNSGSLRIAFLGKGGVGKSVLAGTVCRQLARNGRKVLALDIDTVPGLAISLGIPTEIGRLPTGMAQLVGGKKGRRWQMAKGTGPVQLVTKYAGLGPDGIRFLSLGKLPGGFEPSTSVVFRHVAEGFKRPSWAVVADLAAGTRQVMFGWARFATVRIIVVEPSAKSVLTGQRLASQATHVVANKIRDKGDLDLVRSSTTLPLLGVIPYDETVIEAERVGKAPIEFAPDSPAVRAARELVIALERQS